MKIIIGDKQGYKINGSMKFIKGKIDYSIPFYVEDISGSNNTITIKKYREAAPTLTIEKSLDKVNWEVMGSTSTQGITATVPANGKLYLRCKTNNWSDGMDRNTNVINVSDNCNVGGNIMSLLYGEDFTGLENRFPDENETYIFNYLFYNSGGTKIISARNLQLPAIKLVNQCYSHMFDRCRLITAPHILSATMLAYGCYSGMFIQCNSLITPPMLPAFDPDSDSTRAYERMFYLCTSLATAPELPTISTANKSEYMEMFRDCPLISEIRCLTLNPGNGYPQWVDGVAATGTFYKKAGVTWPTGTSGIPSGWTVVEE